MTNGGEAARGTGAPAVTPRLATRAAGRSRGRGRRGPMGAQRAGHVTAGGGQSRRGSARRRTGRARSMPLQRSNARAPPAPQTRLALFIYCSSSALIVEASQKFIRRHSVA